MVTRSGMVTESYLYFGLAGTHLPYRKVAGLVLSVLLTMELLGIWFTNKLNMAQKDSGDQHRNVTKLECSHPGWIQRNKE